MSVLRLLGLALLRHYRDPLSWAGIITAVATACHFSVPADYVAPIQGILGSVVALLLLAADGRSNPNTTAGGAISERPQTPSGTSPVFTPTALNGRGAVVVPNESLPAGSTLVSSAPKSAVPESQPQPVRQGFGKY